MYRIITVMSVLLLLCNFSVNAQDIPKVNNILFGYSPLGNTTFDVNNDDTEKKYKFKYNTWSADVFKEANYRYLTYMWGFTYTQGKLDDLELKGDANIFDMKDIDKYQRIKLSALGGFTIFPTRRYQIPLFFGVNIGYEKIGSSSAIPFGFELKGLVKYFITNRVGIYAGGSVENSYSNIKLKTIDNDTKKSKEKDKMSPSSIINKMLNVGIIINLN